MLVKGAIGNTFLKIMHWLEDAPSFELFSNIMNLDAQQREYARTLATGFSIVRSPSGRPVHLKIPEFGDQQGFSKLTDEELSDEATHAFMEGQRKKAELIDVKVLPWEVSLAATGNAHSPLSSAPGKSNTFSPKPDTIWRVEKSELTHLLVSPMKTCLRCRPWHQKRCPYRRQVQTTWAQDEYLQKQANQWLLQALKEVDDKTIRWKILEPLRIEFKQRISDNEKDTRGIFYCTFAHWVDEWQHKVDASNDANIRKIGADVLVDIDVFGLG